MIAGVSYENRIFVSYNCSHMIDEIKVQELIAQGEGQHVELKREVPSKVRELSEEVCALANATGGYILLGVDNNGRFTEGFTIGNNKRSALRDSVDQIEPQVDCEIYPLNVTGHEIWVMEVKEGEDKPYFCSGAVHIRRGANSQKLRKPADVRKIFDDAGKLNFDMGVCPWFKWEDVSEEAVRDFKRQAGISSEASSKELITNLGLLTDKGEITNAVPMLFSDVCGKQFINAIIHCVRFKGTENVHIIDSKTFEGPLLSQYNNATAWIKQYLAVEYVMHGFDPRQEIWELPLDAIKEALTNALCHRDYFDSGAKIMVQLYDDRLEISNPGGLLPYVAADFGHRSRSRNPLIFRMFTRLHLVESVGTGIPRIARILSEDGFPPAEYKTEGFFTTILRKKKTSSTEQSDHGSGKSSVESSVKTSVKIKEMMQSNPKVSLREIAEAIGISTRAIEKAVNKLTEEGEITHKGPKKGGEWIVNK